MSTTIYYCACSLDGYIAGPGDDLGWLTGYEGPPADEGEDGPLGEGSAYERFYENVGAVVMGSVTYEWLLDNLDLAGDDGWPYAGKPCWVLTSRNLPVPDGDEVDVRMADARVIDDLHAEMAAAAGGKALWVVGGGDVASQFAQAGLLDELHLTVVPVVLGAGKPLFTQPLAEPLRLTATRPFGNGMVELRYAVRPG